MTKVFIERVFTYPCPSKSFCVELLEKLDEELSLEAELYAELKHDKIVFRVIGLEPAVETSITRIRNFIMQYVQLSTLNPKRGISADQLTKMIRRSIPLNVLAEVLKRQGVAGVEVKNNVIYANIDIDTLKSYAELVANALEKASNLKVSQSLKHVIVAAIALFNISVQEIFEKLQLCGALNEEGELAVPWQKALDCIEELSEEAFSRQDLIDTTTQ
jgi:hypothetical protein